MHTEQVISNTFVDCKNNVLQCCHWCKKLFWSNSQKWYENIHVVQKIPTSQGDDYTTSCFLDYGYLKNYYKMIAIELSIQQALDADPKTK